MSKSLQRIRGTRDLFESEMIHHSDIINKSVNIMSKYSYSPISTPVFEESEVFFRTLGGSSDVVTKETYTFNDRDKTSITLRPELTAGLMRAIISNGLTQSLPQKLYSIGPVFRHERPQQCRYRQFTQIDCEYFGAKHPFTDVETIKLATDILKALGLNELVTLKINSLGDSESRLLYNKALVTFLEKYKSDLSPESRNRLDKNPLRILDSKNQKDIQLLINAPKINAFYNQKSADYWKEVCYGLDELKIPYTIDNKLVRGLDYYCHTVFEFMTMELGSQGTVLAGGRFDGLSELMGGPQIESVGFAAGVERLAQLQNINGHDIKKEPFIYIVSVGKTAMISSMELAFDLRDKGFIVHQDFGNNLGKSLRKANQIGAKICLMIGEDEIQNDVIRLKNMENGYEELLNHSELAASLQSILY